MVYEIDKNKYERFTGSLYFEGMRDDIGLKPLFRSRYPAVRLTVMKDDRVFIVSIHKRYIVISFARYDDDESCFIDVYNRSMHSMFDLDGIMGLCGSLPSSDSDVATFVCEYVIGNEYNVKSYLGEPPGPIKKLLTDVCGVIDEMIVSWIFPAATNN